MEIELEKYIQLDKERQMLENKLGMLASEIERLKL